MTHVGKHALREQACRAAEPVASSPQAASPLDSRVEQPKKKRHKQDESDRAETGALPPIRKELDTGERHIF